ncbi:MAG: hypothetical protein JOZ24_03955 [Candidatus Eremiobacteraeota bacterium]|nr:hypothetical protein [Candidatus Eremiobacteraeota bacterium]
MTVTWEAVSAIAAVVSAIVVVATVVVGVRQVRVAAQQVEHLRRATQLEGTMAVFNELLTPEMRYASLFVLNELPERMNDAAFRKEVALLGAVDVARHPEITVLRIFEKNGVYVKHGLLEGEVLIDYFGPIVIGTWERLRDLGVIAIHRAARGEPMWENYETLYDRTVALLRAENPAVLAALQLTPRDAALRAEQHEKGAAPPSADTAGTG